MMLTTPDIPTIDADLIEPARKLATFGLRALDNAGVLGSLLALAPVSEASTASAESGSLVHSSLVPTSLVAFEFRSGPRRRECAVLLGRDGTFVTLFGLWYAFVALIGHLGPDNAAAAIISLPPDKQLGLARAFVRGRLISADRTLHLIEAAGSGRAFSEMSSATVPRSSWRITTGQAACEASADARAEVPAHV